MRSLLSALLHGQDYLFSGSCRSKKVWRWIKSWRKRSETRRRRSACRRWIRRSKTRRRRWRSAGFTRRRNAWSRYLTLASDQTRHVTISASYWSRPLTKPGYCPEIGTDWFRDLNTSLWLLLAKTDHLTQILTCVWPTTSLILNSHFRRNSRHRRKPSLWRVKVVTKRQLYSCCPAGRLCRTD